MTRLHEMRHSPYCIPIAAILEQSAVAFERVEVPNWDRASVIELTGGRYYQVPVLEHDGELVHETPEDPLRVARHVNRHFSGQDLFPRRLAGVHEVMIGHVEDHLEALGFKLQDIHYVPGIADLSHRMHVIRHKERKFGRGCLEQWTCDEESLRLDFFEALDVFEGCLTENRFLFGAAPVYADYALYGVLGNYLFGGHHALGTHHDWLRAWQERLEGVSLRGAG